MSARAALTGGAGVIRHGRRGANAQGWTDGLLAEGWEVCGYDVEAHQYGDVLTLRGEELAEADLIVSSSPCTEYS